MKKFRIAAHARGPHTLIVTDLLRAHGWDSTGGLDWDLYWDIDAPDEGVFRACGGRRRLNHLYGSSALSNKAALHHTLSVARERLARVGTTDLLAWAPRTFVMPDHFDAWRAAAAWEPDTWWIRKPAALSRGRGVSLIERVTDVAPEAGWIVQEYFASPHLLDGRKYTLRLYVLIESLAPLRVWLHRDGFAKLASRPFSREPEDRADRFRHLTNPDVLADDATAPVSSDNLTLDAYRRRLVGDGVDVDALWLRIRAAVASTILAGCGPMRRAATGANINTDGCFELLGIDVLVDDRFVPHVIECNLGPSLAVEADASTTASREERTVKQQVVADVLRVTGLEPALGITTSRFDPLVPAPDTVALLPCLDDVTEGDLVLWRDACREPGTWLPLAPTGTVHEVAGDDLVLFTARTGEFTTLDAAGAALWLGLSEGGAPESLALELSQATGLPVDDMARYAWQALSTWLAVGMLGAPGNESAAGGDAATAAPRSAPVPWNDDVIVDIRGYRIAVRGPSDLVVGTVGAFLLEDARPDDGAPLDGAIEVRRDAGGFLVVSHGGARIVPSDAAALATTTVREAVRLACLATGAVLDSSVTLLSDESAAVLLLDAAGGFVEAVLAQPHPQGVRTHRRARWMLTPTDDGLVLSQAGGTRLDVRAIAWVRRSTDAAATTRVRPSAALAALVSDDPHVVTAFDAISAQAFVRGVALTDAVVLSAADAASAATALTACLTRPPRVSSSRDGRETN